MLFLVIVMVLSPNRYLALFNALLMLQNKMLYLLFKKAKYMLHSIQVFLYTFYVNFNIICIFLELSLKRCFEDVRLNLSQSSVDSLVYFPSLETIGPSFKRARALSRPPIPSAYAMLPEVGNFLSFFNKLLVLVMLSPMILKFLLFYIWISSINHQMILKQLWEFLDSWLLIMRLNLPMNRIYMSTELSRSALLHLGDDGRWGTPL